MKYLSILILVFSVTHISAQNLYDYDVEKRVKELGIELNTPTKPVANYVDVVQSGNLLFLSGKIPVNVDGKIITGRLGAGMKTDEGYQAARLCGIAQLSTLKAQLGNLNRVVRIVKVTGFVNSTPFFTEQSKVVNGFSDLMVEVFGDRGKHARAAVGMASLPLGAACEVEMIVEIK